MRNELDSYFWLNLLLTLLAWLPGVAHAMWVLCSKNPLGGCVAAAAGGWGGQSADEQGRGCPARQGGPGSPLILCCCSLSTLLLSLHVAEEEAGYAALTRPTGKSGGGGLV